MKNDPHELVDEYNNPEYKKLISKMKEELREQRVVYNEGDEHFPHLQKNIESNWN